jgi:hypothetical protein
MLHLLLLAFGGAFIAQLFSDLMDKERLLLSSISTGFVSILLWRIYSKTNNGTKKRNRQ